METHREMLAVEVTADTSAFRREMEEASRLARGMGSALTAAFSDASFRGRGLESVLQTLAQRLSRLALDAAFRPIEQGLAGLLGNVVGGAAGRITPFAKGGVVSEPHLFGFSGGTGLMGEAGAEAILPLARGPDGRLGVRAGTGDRPVQVNVTIQTRDAESFRRAEGEVAAALARAVARGQRIL